MIRDLQIQNLLRLEVAYKSRQSSLAFTVFSLFIFIYSFNCVEFETIIKTTALMIFVLSIIRMKISSDIYKANRVLSSQWKMIVVLTLLNAIGWSVVFNVASFEHQLTGFHFIVVTTMLAGFIAASLVTLAYDPVLFLPFQFLLLVPQMGLILWFYFKHQMNSLPLLPIYVMYLIYQLKQFKDYRTQIIQRLNYQLDLEHTNSELKISQEALISQTTKLVHTSRLAALGEMSAGIAHEVNNPLAIISGSVQQIERIINRGEQNPEKIIYHSSRCLKSVDRVTKIINGLRHFSQQSDNNPKSITRLQTIIDDTTGFCSELLNARNIKLHIDAIPEIAIQCHPIHISQVLINLIKNAEDALESETDENERWIRLTVSVHDSTVFISVINGGPLIPQELQRKLFQPFFTTKPIGKGTGLGLSISHGLIREHKGDLVFDSSASKTTFILQLPATETELTPA